jgi:hypothetical protein
MVSPRPATGGTPRVTPAPDPDSWLIWQPAGASFAPNEQIGGGLEDRADASLLLAAARATAALDRSHPAHPDLTFLTLRDVVASWDVQSREVFRVGLALAAARGGQIGLRRMLPPDRVWVGVESESVDRYGGFHHASQGYRHVQMAAVVTRHGYLHSSRPDALPALAALDLLRSYVHDSLHYGTFREYVIHGADLFRIRYGINQRTPGGASYSAIDPPDAKSTRNLGVVMEGATDREAHTIARHTTRALGLPEPEDSHERLMFNDTIGALTREDRAELARHGEPDEIRGNGVDRYLAALAAYDHDVNTRYAAFLREIGGAHGGYLHLLIVAAMVSGDLDALSAWLDEQHGEGAFERIFRRPN